jgi:FAD/FMN-containing dehydrogenase
MNSQPGHGTARRAVLVAAAGAAAAPWLLDPGARRLIRATAGVRGSGPADQDWQALRNALSTHRLLRPGQQGYRRARLLFDPRFDYQRPAGVAYCRTPHDVSECLAFVRRFSLPVAARSGGHSYAGWSGTRGLIIDVTGMNSFHAGADGRTVTVGTGLHLIDFYRKLAAHGLAVPGGSCATVGIAGLTLGGGVGVVGRAFGLTSDNLRAAQVVLADGSVVTCDSSHHSDLYWACRGGGGGNFGVATSFTFRAHQLARLVLFFLAWPWARAGQVIHGWQSWAPQGPDALWSNLHLSAAPGGPAPLISVGGTYLGSKSAAEHHLSRLYSLVGSRPASTFIQGTSYLNAMLIEAGCGGLTVDQCHLPWQAPGGRLSRVPSFAKSDFFTRKLPPGGIQALLRGVEKLRQVDGAAGGAGGVAFDAFGGALNRVPAADTAFVHRDALFLAQYTTEWETGARRSRIANQHAWLRAYYTSMRPYASGQCYQNYVDPDLTGWQRAYYGRNFARLTRVKAKYDPAQVFKFPQSIPPAS